MKKQGKVSRGRCLMSKTDDQYWDCECPEDYIHLKKEIRICVTCHQTENDSPDSMKSEIVTYLSNQLARLTDGGDPETTEFIIWMSDTSRTNQDMVSSFMNWASANKYTSIDDLPWEKNNGS